MIRIVNKSGIGRETKVLHVHPDGGTNDLTSVLQVTEIKIDPITVGNLVTVHITCTGVEVDIFSKYTIYIFDHKTQISRWTYLRFLIQDSFGFLWWTR